MQRKEYLDWISTNKLFWGTTICSCLVGMGEFTSLLEYYQPVFDTYGINEKNKWRLIFRLATIHFFIAVCPRLTGCRKIVELCLTALYVYSPKEGGKRAVFGWAGTAPTQCARMVWKWFSYNFLLESKTYILARWDFHLREPRNTEKEVLKFPFDRNTAIGQVEKNCMSYPCLLYTSPSPRD